MGYQMTFKRYELKYLLTRAQKEWIVEAMQPYMKLDQYGRDTIRNLYFDTENYRLIRHSLEKPAYKEKLRVRSYRPAGPDDLVYVEIKKKYRSVVYKRRISLPFAQAMHGLACHSRLPVQSQIASEIEYFRDYYQTLRPTVFLSYEREAYYALDGSDFRITFDENIRYRQHGLTLSGSIYGTPLLTPSQTLMEIKTLGGIPLWMSHALAARQVFKTSFSKYGCAYQQILAGREQGGVRYA